MYPCTFSDQGSNFESQVFQEVCTLLGIQKTHTTPGQPQSDGMVERACRSVQGMLAAFVSDNQNDWDVYIPLLTMAYNSAIHVTTSNAPCVTTVWTTGEVAHRSSSRNS